ncbi:MAG: cyclase family protein [Candidatus Humimicrobiaceae bacterium]
MKLVDLSLALEDKSVSEPTSFGEKFYSPLEIMYMPHDEGAELYMSTYDCKKEELPYGHGNAVEVVHGLTHNGTHMDAPWHFAPTSEGKKSKTIDEVPLEWCFGDCVVLDFRHLAPETMIHAEDVEKALKKINYTIKPFDIVFFQTGADKYWGTKAYQTEFPGIQTDAVEYLIDRGVKLMGVDAYNFDLPFPTQKRLFQEKRDNCYIDPCHYLSFRKEYSHIEKLCNLDKVPTHGFKVACFPLKIKGGSGAWVRVVAFVE